jgi:hypothetical protein
MRCSSAVTTIQIPADEVGVAAVIGIAERALDGVGAHEVEECCGVGSEAGSDVLLHIGEHRLLVRRGQFREGRAFGGLGVGVDGSEPRGIGVARAAQRAGEGAVDVMRCARLGGARAILIGRDETRDDCLQRVGLGGSQRLQCLEPDCL